MSIVHPQRLTCRCGAELAAEVAASINADRHPHLRDAALAATLHRFTCEACGARIGVDAEVLYLDVERRQFFGVYPVSALDRADACAWELDQAFERTVAQAAPAAIRAIAGEFMVRVCFGLDELRDKLRVDDAGLDDVVVEELKARILGGDPRFRDAGAITLWVVDAAPDGPIVMLASDLGAGRLAAPMPPLVVDRATYDDVAAAGRDAVLAARPGLARGTHVSALRLAPPRSTPRPA